MAARLGDDVVEQALELGALPGVARRSGGEDVGGLRQRLGPLADRLRGAEGLDRGLQAVDQLGEAPRELDVVTLDVVEREHALEAPPLVLGHRHAEQQAVEPEAPGAGRHARELERRAVGGVEPPADAAVAHPLLDLAELVVVEAEAAADGLAAGEVEHLRGGEALAGELEQAGDDPEHGVGLAQRPIGEPDAQVRLVAGPERGLDERRERLDVRAHDDHVARLERRVLGELVQDRGAKHFDLTGSTVARVDLDAAIDRRRVRRLVAADPRLEAVQQRVAGGLDRVVVVGVVAEHELELAAVVAPRGEQPVLRERGRLVLAAVESLRVARDLLP